MVFTDKEEANKAKQHTRWLTSSLAGARVKGEHWYTVKFDSVVKQCVLDQDVNDGKTPNKDFVPRTSRRTKAVRRWSAR